MTYAESLNVNQYVIAENLSCCFQYLRHFPFVKALIKRGCLCADALSSHKDHASDR